MDNIEKLKEILNEKDLGKLFNYPSFISYYNDLNKIIDHIEGDIYQSRVHGTYNDYLKLLSKFLIKIELKDEWADINRLSNWFLDYSYSVPEIGKIDRLILDPNSSLYRDLEQTVDANMIQYNEEIYLMQISFLNVFKNFALLFLGNKTESLLINKDKPFSSFFIADLQEKDFENLISLFGKNKSPMEYAIMTCLLSQHNIIYIPEKKRASFHRSWFKLIGDNRSRSSLQPINDYIDSYNVKLSFKRERNKSYIQLKEQFEKLFISFL